MTEIDESAREYDAWARYANVTTYKDAWDAAWKYARRCERERLARSGDELHKLMLELLDGADIRTGIMQSVCKHAANQWERIRQSKLEK